MPFVLQPSHPTCLANVVARPAVLVASELSPGPGNPVFSGHLSVQKGVLMVVSARTKCIWHRSNQTLMHSTTAPRDLKVHFNSAF